LLDGLRVWVTGASSGIGEALVEPLVRRGARVAITARRSSLLDAIAARHAQGGSSPVLGVAADVTDRDAVVAAARQIEAAWGGIDLAIFNAGGSVGDRTRFRGDDCAATMTLNYFSVVYGIDAVLPGMLARGRGHLAAVASLAGYRAIPGAPGYGASKAAVIHLLDGLRFELAPRGIRVTVINPGFVRTPLTAPNAFRMPFLVEPADAAGRIVRGLERGTKEIHFPAPLSWTMKVLRVLPYGLYERFMKRAGTK
jgi:NAD(P)-dependent dehydrogenase (short-subunit alcohol dehydrogenase family)